MFSGRRQLILGALEHRSNNSPWGTPLEDSMAWKYQNRLVDTIVNGPFFTWSYGRSGSASVERNLDIYFCNNS